MDSRRGFTRALLLIGLAFMAFFAAEFLVEWVHLGRPSFAELSWAGRNNAKLVDVLGQPARRARATAPSTGAARRPEWSMRQISASWLICRRVCCGICLSLLY